jgi:hypothetical protein
VDTPSLPRPSLEGDSPYPLTPEPEIPFAATAPPLLAMPPLPTSLQALYYAKELDGRAAEKDSKVSGRIQHDTPGRTGRAAGAPHLPQLANVGSATIAYNGGCYAPSPGFCHLTIHGKQFRSGPEWENAGRCWPARMASRARDRRVRLQAGGKSKYRRAIPNGFGPAKPNLCDTQPGSSACDNIGVSWTADYGGHLHSSALQIHGSNAAQPGAGEQCCATAPHRSYFAGDRLDGGKVRAWDCLIGLSPAGSPANLYLLAMPKAIPGLRR